MSLDPRIQELLDNLEAAANRKTYRAKDFFTPYDPQQKFFDMGAFKRERLLSAGNQCGKSEAGAYEMACHLTGEYPGDWLGKQWTRPVRAWAGGEISQVVRDVIQKKLCGEVELGTGMIPKELFDGAPTTARGIADFYDTIRVKHKSGGVSTLIFKTYEQGREKWQGDTIDLLWFDEEPPEAIYGEGLARLAEGGRAYMTFSPLKGSTALVHKFFDAPTKDQGLVLLTIDDVTHFSPAEKAARILACPPHLRRTRFYGMPAQGEGAVFPILREQIVVQPIPLRDIPEHWVWLWGIDFGVAHPFAAVLAVWDKDTDTIYIVHTIRMSDAKLIDHVHAMKPLGVIPVAWPHDNIRDRGDLKPIATSYKELGLKMLPKHARFADGSNSFEAGVSEMLIRMQTGRLKVFAHLSDWLLECERYHRKDGLVVKEGDDLMSATRQIIMAKRHASRRMEGVWMLRQAAPGKTNYAIGHDDDPWRVDESA